METFKTIAKKRVIKPRARATHQRSYSEFSQKNVIARYNYCAISASN